GIQPLRLTGRNRKKGRIELLSVFDETCPAAVARPRNRDFGMMECGLVPSRIGNFNDGIASLLQRGPEGRGIIDSTRKAAPNSNDCQRLFKPHEHALATVAVFRKTMSASRELALSTPRREAKRNGTAVAGKCHAIVPVHTYHARHDQREQ